MHVTAHVNISSQRKNQKRNNLNCGRIIAGLTKLHQFLLVAYSADNSPHYTVTTSACDTKVGSLASEEPRHHMDFFVWGELERLVCREDPRYRHSTT